MISIPKGKEVKIALNGENIFSNVPGISKNTRIVLTSPITVSLSSEYKNLLGESSGTAVDVLQMISSVVRDVSGVKFGVKFKEQGYQIWAGSRPIKFSFETRFDFKTSGKRDVLLPAKALMKLCLPEESDHGLSAPGPSIITALNKDVGKAEFKRKYSFRCGVFYLPSVIIESVEPTWGIETDSDGYPTSCVLKIDVSSIFTATTNQIDFFDYNTESSDSKGTIY